MLSELRRYAACLRPRRRALAMVFLLGLAGAVAALATPLLGKAFIDAVATNGDYAAIPWIAAALVALALVDLGLAAWSGRVHARLSADVLAELRATLFARCVNAPLADIERLRHGDLLTRFGTDVPRIQTLLVDGVLGALHNVLFLAVAAVITFSLSPALAAWSFVGLALALLAAAAFRRPVERRTGSVREAIAALSHFLSERLSALRAIRLHGAGREEAVRLDAAAQRLNREVVGFQMLDAVATGVPGLALTLALAWIYVAGGALLETGAITLGTFVAFVLYQGRLFAPAQGLLGLVRRLQEARVSLARVGEVLGPGERVAADPVDADATAGDGRTGTSCSQRRTTAPDAIALRDVTFAYEGKPPVFAGATLTIARGERVALFGASGSGKSTLVQLVFGLRRPQAGSVEVCGRAAHAVADGGARRLGYAGTEPFLLHASVEENLRYGNPDVTEAAIARAVALAEADAFVRALPEGLATVIGGRGLALSDGQRQRLGVARLVLADPEILVLDEAMSCLDLAIEVRIRRRLRDAFPGRTALVISHRPVGLDDFDRILHLHAGRFTEVSADQLRARLAGAPAWPMPRALTSTARAGDAGRRHRPKATPPIGDRGR